MKVDLTNLWGKSELSISSKKEEQEIYCKALLIASFPMFCEVEGSP